MNEVDCESSRNVSGLLTSRWTIGDDVMQATLGEPAYISVGSFTIASQFLLAKSISASQDHLKANKANAKSKRHAEHYWDG